MVDTPLSAELAQDGATILPLRPTSGDGAIGAIVKRIEAYRRSKQVIDQAPANDSPRLPLGEEHAAGPRTGPCVRFCDRCRGPNCLERSRRRPNGVGLRLTGAAKADDFAQLIRRHQPLRAQPMTLAGAAAIAGTWQLDAAAWFEPLTGS